MCYSVISPVNNPSLIRPRRNVYLNGLVIDVYPIMGIMLAWADSLQLGMRNSAISVRPDSKGWSIKRYQRRIAYTI